MAEKTQKRGLGTGLGALFGDAGVMPNAGGALMIPIERVEPRADQPRERFSDESLAELADSIGEYGIIQPLSVRKLEGGFYQIIAGERRWRAARLAGLSEVPVRVLEADDMRAMEMALVENLQREDLNPIEEANGYRTLIEEYGMTQEEAAQSIGKSRPAVTNALRLLSLFPGVVALVENGKLSAGHARTLVPIKNEAIQVALAEKAVEESLSVRQMEVLTAKALEPAKPQQKERPEQVDYIADIEKRLQTSLGRRVKVKDGRKRGTVELEYYGAEDREALFDALMKYGKHKEGAV